jgi:lipid-binding SYLF domain-containing protein
MTRHLRIQTLVLILALAATALTTMRAAYAAPTATLDEEAQVALDALYAKSPAARALGDQAKAVLVFPAIHKAALIVGGQSGDGVMFRHGKAVGHYRVDGVLAGAEAGAQSYAYTMFFMSDAAVHKMRSAKGWEFGADPNIVVVTAGAAKEITSGTLQGDIYGYVFNQKGLMGGIALEGLKITRTGR